MARPVRCTTDEEPPVLDISDDESCASLPHILFSEDEIYRIDEEDEDEDSDAGDHEDSGADDHLPPWLWARGPWAAQREDDGNATQGSDSDLHEDDPHSPDDDDHYAVDSDPQQLPIKGATATSMRIRRRTSKRATATATSMRMTPMR